VGPRQADPLLAAHGQRRPLHLGLRLGRQAPPLYTPWLCKDHCRAGLLGLRGAVGGDGKLFRSAAREIKALLVEEGVADMPLGVDIVEVPMMLELQKLGIDVRDAQQTMLQAREIKNIDELMLLNMAAAMVDGVYFDIAQALKPGVKESDIVALATMRLYAMGSDCVEAINAISGERCNPHPHNFTDRIIRPGDQAFFDIIHSYMGYRTCYYRTFSVGRATQPQLDAYKKAREWMDRAIALLKPGVSSEVVRQLVSRPPRRSASPARWTPSASTSAMASASACTSGR
jgi:Xaa-Pro dipeptidase